MDELLIEPEPTERELGTAPIKPLFARYAAITFAGMLAQMVMVVLEGLIIGNGLGPLGLAAVTVILPLELLNLALGGALGMGTAAAAGQQRQPHGKRQHSAQYFFHLVDLLKEFHPAPRAARLPRAAGAECVPVCSA